MPVVVHVLPHTHWDREWYEPFDVYRFNLVKVVDELIDVLRSEPSFHFHFDGQSAAIEDYLEIRPEKEPVLAALVASGQLALGPWRILMDEFLCSGETIVRNLRQGLETSGRLGAAPTIGYIPDSFGHIAQMPQILALAGMTDALVWRGAPFAVDRTAFRWEALDGTSLRTLYLATTYSNAATLPETFEELMVRAKRLADDLEPFAPGGHLLAMNGSDHLGPQRHLPALFAEANERQDEMRFVIGSLRSYADQAPDEGLPTWRGEMRPTARANLLMGVLSARMPLKQLEFRASTALARYAEPLSALVGLDTGLMIERSWRGLVENSAHDSVCGCGVDSVATQVAARYERAVRVADVVAADALRLLGERIDTSEFATSGAVVFNPSPTARAGVLEATLTLPGASEELCLRAPDGTRLAVQPIATTEQVVVDMEIAGEELARIVPTIHSRKLGPLHVNRLDLTPGAVTEVRMDMGPIPIGAFDIAAAKDAVERAALADPAGRFHVTGTGPPLVTALIEVPPVAGLGWVALEPRDGAVTPAGAPVATARSVENEALQVEVNDDGTFDLTDRSSGLRFERIGLRDGGDAGDEYNYSPPERDTVLEKADLASTTIVSSGPLEARLRIKAIWRIPISLESSRARRSTKRVAMPVEIDVALRKGERFARVDVSLDNTADDHRVRLRVPVPFEAAGSHADTAFGVVGRSLTAEAGPHEQAQPSFPSRTWASASGANAGIAVLHHGTPEYETGVNEIAVTLLRCVGWLSRQDLRTRTGPAGPVLAAPGAQLRGSHRFSLALYPFAGDWASGGVLDAAEAFSVPMRASAAHPHPGSLEPSGGALSIEPAAVRCSAIERRGGGVEVRLYNASEQPVTAKLRARRPLEFAKAERVTLTGDVVESLSPDEGALSLPLRAWEIATIRLV